MSGMSLPEWRARRAARNTEWIVSVEHEDIRCPGWLGIERHKARPPEPCGHRLGRAGDRTTVMVRVPKGFVDKTLWPHFQRASEELRRHLDEVAEHVIGAAMEAATGDEEVRAQEQQLLPLATIEESPWGLLPVVQGGTSLLLNA